jgi:GST-like protein
VSDLSAFPITKKWPARHPERLQLYSLPTPNGIKVSAALEELGLPYEAHTVSFGTDDQLTPEFMSLNPNNKIPAIIDPDGPGGKPLGLWESGAILIYLADKTGKLMPKDGAARYECIQWLMFQMGGIGPMFGQVGHFYKFAADKITDSYPTERRLAGRAFIMGDDYTIADIATWPWLRTMVGFYDAAEAVGFKDFPNAQAWLDRCASRPASEKSINIPPRA